MAEKKGKGADEAREKRKREAREHVRELEDEAARKTPGKAGEKTTRREPRGPEDRPPATREPTLESEPPGKPAGGRSASKRGEEFFEHFRQRLLEERSRIARRLDELRGQLEELDDSPARELEELAQEEKDRDILIRLEDRETEELKRIRAALEMIDVREYGICQSCGRNIPKARLEELPTAFRCVHCSS